MLASVIAAKIKLWEHELKQSKTQYESASHQGSFTGQVIAREKREIYERILRDLRLIQEEVKNARLT